MRKGKSATADSPDGGAVENYIEPISSRDLERCKDARQIDPRSKLLLEGEAEYIRRWRASRRHADESEVPLSRQPDGLPHNLIGLALSGGGIRSATFALGVLQALAKRDLLRAVDYLSTVSGGGFLGASLVWLLNPAVDPQKRFGLGPQDFPYGSGDPEPDTTPDERWMSAEQRKMLGYLREHGNYLTPGDDISLTSGIAVVLRGILVNLTVALPILVALMLFPTLADFWPRADNDGFLALLALAAWAGVAFWLFSLVYALFTSPKRETVGERGSRYLFRRGFEKRVRWPLWIALAAAALGAIPIVHGLIGIRIAAMGGPIAAASGALLGLWTFLRSGRDDAGGSGILPTNVIATIGAGLLIYGVLISAYAIADAIDSNKPGWILLLALAISLIVGWASNVNYLSLHRYYRDRLMETFMPPIKRALAGQSGPSRQADELRLHAALQTTDGKVFDPKQDPRAPYHLINANVILVDSLDRRRKIRGGDSFVLSALRCGSNATGWADTTAFMGGEMVLSTAMAISGAAANPNTGVGGVGLTRNPMVSILMSLLNLRLGYWAPNPDRRRGGRQRPNFFHPGVYELGLHKLLFPADLTKRSAQAQGEVLTWPWLIKHSEHRQFVQLSDGGHFDNLGLYELVRRRARLILVIDGTADPACALGDLQNALNLIETDFGARVDFERPNHAPSKLVPRHPAGYPKDVLISERGHLVGRILYRDGHPPGVLVYLKSAIVDSVSLEILGYKSGSPDFPNESTADQFFDEKQFEAYRRLGYHMGKKMLAESELDQGIAALVAGNEPAFAKWAERATAGEENQGGPAGSSPAAPSI